MDSPQKITIHRVYVKGQRTTPTQLPGGGDFCCGGGLSMLRRKNIGEWQWTKNINCKECISTMPSHYSLRKVISGSTKYFVNDLKVGDFRDFNFENIDTIRLCLLVGSLGHSLKFQQKKYNAIYKAELILGAVRITRIS